jgi:hypothetical protein
VGKIHHTNVFLLPGNVAGDGIVANAHDLGIEAGETCQFGIERRHLGGSGGRPVQGMKGDYHVLFAAIVAEAKFVRLFPNCPGQFEIRGYGSHRQCRHESST